MALSPAVFLDKDGTLVHDVPFNVDPSLIRLRDDAGTALALLQRRGYRLVLISNQPGLAHGFFAANALDRMWTALAEQLAGYGVALDAIYFCPHHPQGVEPRLARVCDCRKPQPGLLLQAAREHGLDVCRSWMIGDILDDVEAGHRAGCRSILLDVGSETEWRAGPEREPDFVARSLSEAVAHVLALTPRSAGAVRAETEALEWEE